MKKAQSTIIGALTMWVLCLIGVCCIGLLLGYTWTFKEGTAAFIALTMLRVALR